MLFLVVQGQVSTCSYLNPSLLFIFKAYCIPDADKIIFWCVHKNNWQKILKFFANPSRNSNDKEKERKKIWNSNCKAFPDTRKRKKNKNKQTNKQKKQEWQLQIRHRLSFHMINNNKRMKNIAKKSFFKKLSPKAVIKIFYQKLF